MKSAIALCAIIASCLAGISPAQAQVFVTADTFVGSGLFRFDDDTETFAETIDFPSLVQGLARHNNTLLVADYGTNQIQRFTFDGTLLTPFASVTAPAFLEVDSSNNVFTTQLDTGIATSFDSAGTLLHTFTSPHGGAFRGIDADADGYVYIAADLGSSMAELQKFTFDGTFVSAVSLSADPMDMVIDEAGERLFLADRRSRTAGIQVFDISGGAPSFTGTIPTPWVEKEIFGLHYAPETDTIYAAALSEFPSPGWAAHLALDGTVLETYEPADNFVVADVVSIPPAGLPGDFNGDGMVDAADYTVWRNNLGGDEAALSGNGNGDNVVDQDDYLLWKAQFGMPAPPGLATASNQVPEPSAMIGLLLLTSLGVAGLRRRSRPLPNC